MDRDAAADLAIRGFAGQGVALVQNLSWVPLLGWEVVSCGSDLTMLVVAHLPNIRGGRVRSQDWIETREMERMI